MVDFANYVTPPPPNSDGLSMFTDVLKAIAQRKQEMEIAKMEDAQRRSAEQMQATGRANALREAGRHNLAGEQHNTGVLGETGRHNLATEGNAAASLTQQKAMALSKLLAMPGTQQALQATDSGPMDALAPALAPLGAQVQRPGEPGPDDVMPDSGAPESQRRDVVGPDGPMVSFDPATNAVTRARRAMEARDQAERASQGMNKYDAAGMRAGGGAAAALAEAGADPLKALEGGQKFATSSSAQATSRTNAQTAAAAQGQRVSASGERLDRKDARTESQNFEKTYEVNENRDKYRITSEAMRNLATTPNGLITKQILFGLAKANDSGKLSDQDYARSVGGADVATRIKSWAAGLTSGDLSDAEKKRVTQALKVQHAQIEKRLKNAQGQYDEQLVADPVFDQSKDYLEGRRQRLFGDLPWNAGKKPPRTPGKKPPGAGAGQGGTVGARAGGEDADARLKQLLDKYGVK